MDGKGVHLREFIGCKTSTITDEDPLRGFLLGSRSLSHTSRSNRKEEKMVKGLMIPRADRNKQVTSGGAS